MPNELPTRDGYDRWSSTYDEYPNPLIVLETPEVKRMVGDVRGRDVLDVGCGTGRHATWLERAGARVTAIDFSEGMLAEARAKDESGRTRFLQHDLHDPLPFGAESFDTLVHCLALDHLDSPQEMIGEFARVLRPTGQAVISVMHPAMFLKGTQARFLDPESGELILIENKQYTIADYVMAVRGAGLELEALSEHNCTRTIAETIPRAEKYIGYPMLLMLGLRKRIARA